MNDNTDIAPRLVHASSLVPSVSDGIVTSNCIEVVATIESADHVDQVVQRAKSVVSARRKIHVNGEEPAVGAVIILLYL